MRDPPFTAVAFGFRREKPMVALRSCEIGISTGVCSGNQAQQVETNGYRDLAVNQSMEFCAKRV
jgi:hypothetical protein